MSDEYVWSMLDDLKRKIERQAEEIADLKEFAEENRKIIKDLAVIVGDLVRRSEGEV